MWDWYRQLWWRTVTSGASPDVTAPSVPGNLAASSITATTLTLTWDASTDAVGVTEYEVQQRPASGVNGDYVTIGTVAAPTVTLAVTGLIAATEYRFRVRAKDAAGNASAWGPDDTGLLATTLFVFVAPTFSLTSSLSSTIVLDVLPDGAGGFYVGGWFDQIVDANGTHSRLNICHLDHHGNVTSWNPGSDTRVCSIKRWGDYLVVGKYRSPALENNTLGGVDCEGFGLVSINTGVGLAWDPAYKSDVTHVEVVGNTVYIVGRLAETLERLKKYDLTTLMVTSFSFAANTTINSMRRIGERLYFAWDGSSTSTPPRQYFFALDLGTDNLSAWSVGVVNGNGGKRVVPVDANHVMVCGLNMTSVQGATARGAAIVDAVTGARTAWLPAGARASADQGMVVSSGIVLWAGGTPAWTQYDATTGAVIAGSTPVPTNAPVAHAGFIFGVTPTRALAFSASGVTSMGAITVSGTRGLFVVSV